MASNYIKERKIAELMSTKSRNMNTVLDVIVSILIFLSFTRSTVLLPKNAVIIIGETLPYSVIVVNFI